MSDKFFAKSQLPIRRSVDLLPEVFKTETNSKFMAGVVDPLIQPGVLEKTVGYIGRRYGKTYKSSDIYLDNDQTLRSRYQLEPGVVIKDDNGKITNFYDYIDFKNQLKFFGNYSERDDLTTAQDHYSWNPPINWDKFINYREYFWVPQGPPTVRVFGQGQKVVSTYRVRLGAEGVWTFTPDGLTNNPTIKLYRGQTYVFDVNAPRNNFHIRTSPTVGMAANYTTGVTNAGSENGKIRFTVPLDAPDVLYYQSEQEPDRHGTFIVDYIESNSKIDVNKEIIGKINYKSSNDVEFTNGLIIEFVGETLPTKYKSDRWIVEGVGKAIQLIRYKDLLPPSINKSNPEVLFDNTGFDTEPYDDATNHPVKKDYITIDRGSIDLNPWTRYNRWFHRSVLEYANKINGTDVDLPEDSRAKRPIIEFLPNVQLFNHGAKAKQEVDFIDTFTKDVFSTIEGATGYNIDGEFLFQGARILVTADTDSWANNKIYEVNFIVHNNKTQISLIETSDTAPILDECVLVRRGNTNAGLMYHFNGVNWLKSQEKTDVNQPPLFDVFDSNEVRLSDQETYPVSSFKGTEILSYKIGTGVADTELGFKISYLNIDNIGDIQFEFDWDKDTFGYNLGSEITTKNINTGFYRINDLINDPVFENSWTNTNSDSLQSIIESQTIESVTNTVKFTACEWKPTTEKIIFYLNGYLFTDTYERPELDTFVFSKNFAVNDVLTIKVFSDQVPNLGYYEFPLGIERNPINESLESFTLGQATDHAGSMVELSNDFVGEYPGISNLRDISSYQQYGRRFLKHSVSAPGALSLICGKRINLIRSIQYAKKAYSDFKNNFLTLASELFYDQSSNDFVDQIILSMSKAKSKTDPFADSDMIGSGAYTKIEYVVEDEGIKTFALSESFDLSTLSRKAVYVYINDKQLLVGEEYEFNSNFGFVTILKTLVEGDVIEIREYVSTSFSYVPATPTSMGLYKKYKPMIYVDDTYQTPTKVIQGHDGSLTVAYNDIRDDVLLELEKRIYNNIKQNYDSEYYDIDKVIGGYYGNAIYGKQDVDPIINREFLKWVSNSDIDYVTNSYYEDLNTFTYTYSNMTDPTRTQNLPGFWRGVYQWFYDTDRPHLRPWEMLGFSEEPTWWVDEYGPAPYTRNNLILWEDLENGIIRQGALAGEYDRYKRPGLTNYIPVDGDGKLLSPLDSGLAQDFVLINNKGDFKLGDISPAENAWRKSSEYPFAIVIALCLLRPFDYIGKSFNRSQVRKNKIGQYVDSTTSVFQKIEDIDVSVAGETLTAGLVNWIMDYLRSKAVSADVFKSIIGGIDVALTSRVSGFVDQSQQKYLLDSKSPKSASSSIFIPPENYDIFFNVSVPISSIGYSGVIFEKTNGGWRVTGYDSLEPYFTYFEPVAGQTDPLIEVGGVSDAFVDWTAGKYYNNGQIVRNKGFFYRTISSHTAGDTFNTALYKQIPKLPQVGAVEAFKRRNFNKLRTVRLNYGTVLTTVQSVVDFLLGYEQYLKSLGLMFNGYDATTQTTKDWFTACKEFMFWTKHNWAAGSLITLSPAADALDINIGVGVADDILDDFYEYQIFKSDGTPLLPRYINVNRDIQKLTLSTTDTTDGIYFARINFVLKEHVVAFSDRTVFNDVIYDKTTGYRQDRIKVRGFRTTDWDGDYTSPGFLFDNVNIQTWAPFTDYKLGDIVAYREFYWTSIVNQSGVERFDPTKWSKLDLTPTKGLVSNFDYKINQFDDYYDLDSDGVGSSQRELGRHAIGYQQRTYLQNIAEDDVSQFKIYQGFIREKGTPNAITKVFDKLSRSGSDSIKLYEEWAFRVGQLGGLEQSKEYEIKLNKESFQLNPQPILIQSSIAPANLSDKYIRVSQSDFTITPLPYSTAINPTYYYPLPGRSAGYVRSDQVNFIVKNRDDILNLDVADFGENSTVWVTFDGADWTVLQYNSSNFNIGPMDEYAIGEDSTPLTTPVNFVKVDTTVIIGLQNEHTIQVGDIVGITNVQNLTGFYKVTEAVSTPESRTITVEVPADTEDPVVDGSTNIYIGVFSTVRYKSYADVLSTPTLVGAKRWIDQNESGLWEVWEKVANPNDWTLLASQPQSVNLNLLKSVSLYDPVNNVKISDIDVIDNFKLKVLGLAEQEIKFKTPYDPAIYMVGPDVSTDDIIVDESQAWFERNVGAVWWNISTAKWVWYEQGDTAFRAGNWNQLAYGASIDIYEWVESVLLPSEWAALADTNEGLSEGISGQPLYPDDTVYNFKELRNTTSGEISGTLYYYWVKNKATLPNIPSRRTSAIVVASYILNPAGSGEPIVALIESDKFLAYNFGGKIPSDTALFNIEFNTTIRNLNQIHSEYQLIAEGNASSVPTNTLETKWIDSLIGFDQAGNQVPDPNIPEKQKYGISFRPRQNMFVNRAKALEIAIKKVNDVLLTKPFTELLSFENLNKVSEVPVEELNLYDQAVDTFIDLETVGTARVRQAILRAVVVEGVISEIVIVDPGFGYKVAPPIDIQGTGVGAKAVATLDAQGRIASVTVTQPGRKYTSATARVRNFSVLVRNDSTLNNFWTIYAWDQKFKTFYRSGTQGYNTPNYWTKVDWYETGYSSTSRIVKEINSLYLEPTLTLEVGDLLRVKEYGDGGWALLERVAANGEILGKYRLVGRNLGTIQLKEELYNPSLNNVGYDTASSYDSVPYDLQPIQELRFIFTAIKEDIFIDELAIEWNKLFFSSVGYVFSEQLYVDWAFKTSFLSAIHQIGDLAQKTNYKSDNLESFEDYLNEVKPYRTKIREYSTQYTELQMADSVVTDFDKPVVWSDVDGKAVPIPENSEELLTYPWKFWNDNRGYSVSSVVIADAGSNYTSPPTVLITSDTGAGATAQAYISNGKVSGIVLLSEGSGYLTAPTVSLVGGNGQNTPARAVAILGNGKVRSFNIGIKFDRISKQGTYSDLAHSEAFVASGSTSIFQLSFAPTRDKSKITVYKNGELIFGNEYTIDLYTSKTDSYGLLRGRLKFLTAPAAGDSIAVFYDKNDSLLDAVNRVEKYYSPTSGMIGYSPDTVTGEVFKDVISERIILKTTKNIKPGMRMTGVNVVSCKVLEVISTTEIIVNLIQTLSAGDVVTFINPSPNQLMTGIDFGGVQVQGNPFDVTGGWDALPWFTDSWDSVESSADFYYVVGVETYSLTTTYKVGAVVTVTNGGETQKFRAIATTTGNAPATSPQYWELFDYVTLPFVPAIDQPITVYLQDQTVTTKTVVGTTIHSSLITVADTTGIATGMKITGASIEDCFVLKVNSSTEIQLTQNRSIDDGTVLTFTETTVPEKMETVISDGSTAIMPLAADTVSRILNGSVLIFRTEDSDGTVNISDPNLIDTALSGGTLETMRGAYITATGRLAEDIIVDGEKFTSPDQVPATEENVPGQVLDSVSIKVFHSTQTGSPSVLAKVISIATTERTYPIGQSIIENDNLTVYIDKIKLEYTVDYNIDFANNTITLVNVPVIGTVLEIVSIGLGGVQILDYQEFIADGATRLFLTNADYKITSSVLVTINGNFVETAFSNSRTAIGNNVDKTIVEVGEAPTQGSVIKIVSLGSANLTGAAGQEPVIRANQQTIIFDGSTYAYPLDHFVDLGLSSARGSVIVERNGLKLRSSDTVFRVYDGTNNLIQLGEDPVSAPGTIAINDIKVYVNDLLLDYILDWTFDGTTNLLEISAAKLTVGDKIRIEQNINTDFDVVNNSIVLSSSIGLVEGDEITVTWFNQYPTVELVKEVYAGGKSSYPLSRKPISIAYVWVYKNGERLSPGVEYLLDADITSIRIYDSGTSEDLIEIVQFGSDRYRGSVAYEIFKDMLNTVHYKRYSINNISLAQPLNYYDTSLTVTDASTLKEPSISTRVPGIVEINNERIEYFVKNGNVLSQLRRGTLGTAIAELHDAGSSVVDVSVSETIPYNEKQEKQHFTSTGNSLLVGPLDFVPRKASRTTYKNPLSFPAIPADNGECDEIEVFVGGRRLHKGSRVVYDELIAASSPEADVTLEAEFTVDGVSRYVRLTEQVPAGIQITVIRKTGRIWYDPGTGTASSGKTMLDNTSDMIRFVEQKTTKLP